MIVTGKNQDMIQSFLTTLSFFLRCNELYMNIIEGEYKLFGRTESESSEEHHHHPHDVEHLRSSDSTSSLELQLVELDSTSSEQSNPVSFPFATSLMADLYEGYSNYFVLMGVIASNQDFIPSLCLDLQALVTRGLDLWSQSQLPIKEGTCIIIDIDKWLEHLFFSLFPPI